MTPDAAGIEAALAAGLAATVAQALHNVPGVECDHIDGMQPTCESDAAHVAAALLPVVTQAQAAERERIAQAIEAEAARMHAAFAAEEDELLAELRDRQPRHWNRHDDGCAMCGMSSAARIARADESGA